MIDQIKAWVKATFYTKREVDQRVDVNATALTAHAALTAAHGATGAVVGTTNSQTLTNKTLTSPAISDPVITGSTGAWTALTLNSGGNWANYGGSYYVAAYKKVGDLVFVRGLVVRSSGSDTLIATLPSGHRPGSYSLHVTSGDDAFARIDIETDGEMRLQAGTAAVYVSLDGLIFSVV